MNKALLKDISKQISSGLTPLRSNLEFWNSEDIPWVKTEQLGIKNIYDSNEKVSKAALEKTSLKFNPENSLSIAMYGEGKTRGRVSILKNKMATNQACCNIVIDEDKANYEYVYYFLKTQYQELRNLSFGVRKNLNSNDIKNFEVRFPENLNTQLSIANTLSDLDKKIELNNKINTELEVMAKLIYDYWFVQFDFPDASGKPYKSSGGKMVYNEVLKREIPDGWGNGTLTDLGEIVGGSAPSTKNSENFTESGMPWITPKDLSKNVGNKFIACGGQNVSEEGIKSASLKIYPKNTVLMSSRAPIGYMAIASCELTTNQGFKSFIPNKGFASDFIFYAVKNSMKAIIQYSSGSTFKEVSGSVLKTVKVCLPKPEIAESYSNNVKSIFSRQSLSEEESKQLSKLRDWLLPMLMNGQVTVNNTEKST